MRRSIFKYFSERRFAERFIEGEALFRSLSYFRDCEDAARADENEGTSVYRPNGGLVITKEDGTQLVLEGSFESSAKADEIYAFCLSRSFSSELASQFHATACVEITTIRTFCARMQSALPSSAKFFGGRITYYDSTLGPKARWALPEQIATSKTKRFAHEMEFRIGFSVTDALAAQNVGVKIVRGQRERSSRVHREHLVTAGSLSDIARLREL